MTETAKVIRPDKQSPVSKRWYRVIENRTPDTGQIINYSLEAYSNMASSWYSIQTSVQADTLIEAYDANTAAI